MGVRRVGFRNTVGFCNKGEFRDTVWHPVMRIRTLNIIGALRRGQNLLYIQIAQMYLAHGFTVLLSISRYGGRMRLYHHFLG